MIDGSQLDLIIADASLPPTRTVAVGQIAIEAPSAPGSESSRDAAASISREQMQREQRKVLMWFAAQSNPRTRHELADAIYPGTGGLGPACARVKALLDLGYLEEVGRSGKRATIAITSKGRNHFKNLKGAA